MGEIQAEIISPPLSEQFARQHRRRIPRLMNVLRRLIQRRLRSSFRLQGRTDQWEPRGTPSVAGILQDMQTGRSARPERFSERPVLVVSGTLRDSIKASQQGTIIRVRAEAPYAGLHQHGGVSELPGAGRGSPSRQVRRNLTHFLRMRRDLRGELGWLFSRDTVRFNIPARPFMNLTDEDMADIQRITERFMATGVARVR